MAILGLFRHVDVMIDAAKKLKDSGYKITIFSPIPLSHELEHALGERKNHIRYFTFAGGFIGFCFGMLLTLGTAALYILPRGGRPIFFMTPSLLISYETTILFGVLFSYLGFLIFAKLPSYKKRAYDVNVTIDSFGLLVETEFPSAFMGAGLPLREAIATGSGGVGVEDIKKILMEHEATEVKIIEKN